MKPGIVITDETREIVNAYLAKQRKRIEKRMAKRQEKMKETQEWMENFINK